MYPNAVWMAAELATYGFVIGFIYRKFKAKEILRIYISLILSMLSGRIAWGVVKALLLGLGGNSFTLAAFITGGFVDSLLGIVLQLILIPLLLTIIKKYSPNNEKE